MSPARPTPARPTAKPRPLDLAGYCVRLRPCRHFYQGVSPGPLHEDLQDSEHRNDHDMGRYSVHNVGLHRLLRCQCGLLLPPRGRGLVHRGDRPTLRAATGTTGRGPGRHRCGDGFLHPCDPLCPRLEAPHDNFEEDGCCWDLPYGFAVSLSGSCAVPGDGTGHAQTRARHADFVKGLRFFDRRDCGQVPGPPDRQAGLYVDVKCTPSVLVRTPIIPSSLAKLMTHQCNLSIAELNVGLMCCCLPVIFVLFKSVGIRSETTWASIRGWLRAWSRGTSSSKMSSTQVIPIKSPGDSSGSGPETLPQVPKGTLSGLMSFVRGGSRPEQRSGWGSLASNHRTETRVELQTIDDYSYHTYLNDRSVGSGKSSDPTVEHV